MKLQSGALTFQEAGLLKAGIDKAIDGGDLVLDFSDVTSADSSILALILHALRRAKKEGKSIELIALTPDISALASLYGIGELLAHDK